MRMMKRAISMCENWFGFNHFNVCDVTKCGTPFEYRSIAPSSTSFRFNVCDVTKFGKPYYPGWCPHQTEILKFVVLLENKAASEGIPLAECANNPLPFAH